jgi:hypothetical protein
MAAQKLNKEMESFFGDNTKMINWKDLEHLTTIKGQDIQGGSCRIRCTDMEY